MGREGKVTRRGGNELKAINLIISLGICSELNLLLR